MRDEVRNMDASVKARLKNIAKEYKKPFNLILQLKGYKGQVLQYNKGYAISAI